MVVIQSIMHISISIIYGEMDSCGIKVKVRRTGYIKEKPVVKIGFIRSDKGLMSEPMIVEMRT
jgi:hypothetical protein